MNIALKERNMVKIEVYIKKRGRGIERLSGCSGFLLEGRA